MNKVDMHFHTTMSDGKLNNQQVINEAKQRGLDFMVVTEHDIINTKLPILANQNWIQNTQWVEISAHDDKITDKSLHITSYANKFSWDIIDMLEKTRNWKVHKIKIQIETLQSNWFNIDYKDFIDYCLSKWFNVENLNSSHIDNYIYEFSENIELIKKITWEEIKSWDFIWRCLKEKWDFSHLWWKKIDKYEPTIEEIWKIAKEWWYFLSLAHPNFTFRNDFELFELFMEEYKDVLNWIEINTLASEKWVKIILETSKKYDLILTFWSDDHFERTKKDSYHWIFWYMNQHISEWDIMKNFKQFILLINTLKSIKK